MLHACSLHGVIMHLKTPTGLNKLKTMSFSVAKSPSTGPVCGSTSSHHQTRAMQNNTVKSLIFLFCFRLSSPFHLTSTISNADSVYIVSELLPRVTTESLAMNLRWIFSNAGLNSDELSLPQDLPYVRQMKDICLNKGTTYHQKQDRH